MERVAVAVVLTCVTPGYGEGPEGSCASKRETASKLADTKTTLKRIPDHLTGGRHREPLNGDVSTLLWWCRADYRLMKGP